MPIKSEEALGYLDIDLSKFENVDAFKEQFDKEWVKAADAANNPDIQNRATSKLRSVLRSALKKHVGAFELEGVEINDETDPVKLLKELHEPIANKYNEKIASLESAVKDKSGDKVLKEWESKYGELDKKYKDLDGLHKTQVELYKGLETSVAEEKKSAKINGVWEQAVSAVKFKTGLDELTKDGFLNKMRKEYQVMFDEDGNPYTADREGKRIADKAKAQKFRELPDLLAERAKEFKLDQSNHQAGAPLNRPIVHAKEGEQNGVPLHPLRKTNQIHPGRELLRAQG